MDKTISTLVQSQFPDFVREEYPALVQFIEAYFKFLELEKNPQDILSNLIAYTDIDRTLDEFVANFEKTYIDGLPVDIAGDKRHFIKHVRDLYQTKGTEESFKLLFRVLFDEDIEIYYPKQQMLRVSDGRWEQRNSIKVKVQTGIAKEVLNKKIKIRTEHGVINTHVNRVVEQVNGIVELYVDKQFSIPVAPGDIVTAKDFSAICQPTVVQCTVMSAGQGFHVGQVFDVQSVTGSGTKVKVTRIDSNGGIKRLAFISFGDGYTTDFMATLQPDIKQSGTVDPYKSYTNGFIESVLVTKVTYFSSDYADVTYSGTMIASTYEDDYRPDNAIDADITPAKIKFTLGALCAYRGEYTSAEGFLSDVNVIQDGYMYQDFSYVIKTKQRIQDYAAIVKRLIHPAGTVMIGEMQSLMDIDLGVAFEYEKVLAAQMELHDSSEAIDFATIFTQKVLTDSVSPLDDLKYAMIKVLDDYVTSIDTNIKLHSIKVLTEEQFVADVINTIGVGKNLTEEVTPSDSNISKDFDKYRTDTAKALDSITLNNSKILDDWVTINDSEIFVVLSDYVDPSYFSQNYVGTVLI